MTIVRLKHLTASAIVLVMLMARPSGAAAASMQTIIHDSGSYRELVIEGAIEPGDFEKFIKSIRDNQGRIVTVYIFSPGGDFYEAMKIGRAMRSLELSSMVPMRDRTGRPSCGSGALTPKPNDPSNCTCASAGFFIHIGSVHRGGTFLAVHRPYFSKGRFGELSEIEAKKEFNALQNSVRDYMQAMEVPKHIQEDVLGTPSNRGLILDEKTVKTYFWGALPHRHEWVRNKCSRLSEEEEIRMGRYSEKLLKPRNSPAANFSAEELADLQGIRKKQDDELSCAVAVGEKSRLDAYEKYFRTKPSDHANHNFAAWSEATKYLGRNVDDLLRDGKFKESKMVYGMTSLTHSATATEPSLILFDSPTRLRIVSSVGLVSPPHPSDGYLQRLIKQLESTWGKAARGKGAKEWLWESSNFRARLVHDISGEGPSLRLTIDQNI